VEGASNPSQDKMSKTRTRWWTTAEVIEVSVRASIRKLKWLTWWTTGEEDGTEIVIGVSKALQEKMSKTLHGCGRLQRKRKRETR
jgi:hypothetical protein